MKFFDVTVETYLDEPQSAIQVQEYYLCCQTKTVEADSYWNAGEKAIAETKQGEEAWHFYYVVQFVTEAEFHPTRKDCQIFEPDEELYTLIDYTTKRRNEQ